jgi:hypothetical protein
VVLDAAVAAAALPDRYRGADLAWRFAGRGVSFFDDDARPLEALFRGRDLRPLAPVHLAARREAGGVRFSWIRRTRMGGDAWAAREVPLAEAAEAYVVELFDAGAAVWTTEVAVPEALLTSADEAALFPGAPLTAFDLRVAQISERAGAGAARRAVVHL